MNRVHLPFRLLIVSLALCSCFLVRTFAQTQSPSPQENKATTPKEEANDPFAPEKAKPLPEGMTGSDVNDPRSGRSTYRLTNINRADPDPALFKVPAGYTMSIGRGGR